MEETYQQWFDGKDFGDRTWAASTARPYKLDTTYTFALLGGAPQATTGKVVDAADLELVLEIMEPEHRLIVIGRSAIKSAVEMTP